MSAAKINWSNLKAKRVQSELGISSRKRFTWGAGLIVLLAAFFTILGFWYSSEPDLYDGYVKAEELAGPNPRTGALTTASVIVVMETLLEKNGGLISNDITPPSIVLDNMPSWERGVIDQVRVAAKAMRDSFSRSQSQSQEDTSLAEAEPNFNFGIKSWIFPSSENEYRKGIQHMHDYLERLQDEEEFNAQFFARADNLEIYLASVENRLGSLSQRLSASVGQRRLNTDLAGERRATQATPTADEFEVKTPWLEIDNVFFEARGSTWALTQFLTGIEQDFASILEGKNAKVSLQQIIRELEAAQAPIRAPMITRDENIYGFFPNHSLVMASYISRAHAAIIDLRELLAK